MKISVLMCVYYKEKEKNLDKAIKSIINQTLQPQEIVIIKDGRLTIELYNVLNKYLNEYPDLIKIYGFDEHKGLGEALRYGVKKCVYEYIARMDSDDIALPYRLEEQAKFLKINPEIDILGGYIEEYDENMENLIMIRKVPLKDEQIKDYIKTQSPFNHMTVIMKKSAVINVGNYNNTLLEDYDLWGRMKINGCNMQNLDLILCKVRTGREMYKRRTGIKQIKKVCELEKNLLAYGIINKKEYKINIIIRSFVAVLPINLKKIIYKTFIRNYRV